MKRHHRKSQSKNFDDSMIQIGFTREQLVQHLRDVAKRIAMQRDNKTPQKRG